MKKILPLVFAFLYLFAFSKVASAQEGIVTFQRTVKMEFELPPEMESMRDQIPMENSTNMVLRFNEYESLMKAAEDQEAGEDHVMQGGGVMIRMSGSGPDENEIYLNYDEGKLTEKRDFMGRTFLIDGDQPSYAWKLSGEQSEYMGYAVQKATAVQDSTTIEAWFSPDIPVSAGPGLYGGLPGMILVLSINDGQTVFSAQEIVLEGAEEGAIKAPKEGKKVSQAEFDEIVEEKMKEMNAQRSGRGGNVVRIMRH